MKASRIILLVSLLLVGILALSACSGAPAAEQPAASEEAVAEEPAAEAPAEEAAAEAPAAGEEEALGASLIGEIEGPKIITDESMYPTEFSEAPMLTELVDSGELPPVAERLPAATDVLVIEPVHEIGK